MNSCYQIMLKSDWFTQLMKTIVCRHLNEYPWLLKTWKWHFCHVVSNVPTATHY